jgi:hypothetical protein
MSLTGFLVFLVRLSAEPPAADLGAAVALLRVLAVALVLVVERDLFALTDQSAGEETDTELAVDGPLKSERVLSTTCAFAAGVQDGIFSDQKSQFG